MLVKANNLHNPTFPSFNIPDFTDEDDMVLLETETKIHKEEMLKITQFCNFWKSLGKISVSKILFENLCEQFSKYSPLPSWSFWIRHLQFMLEILLYSYIVKTCIAVYYTQLCSKNIWFQEIFNNKKKLKKHQKYLQIFC